jgi:hypothetical protein
MRINDKLITTAANDLDFLLIIITDDEAWCFLYDPQSKQQSFMWKLPVATTEREIGGSLFFDWQGFVCLEFISMDVNSQQGSAYQSKGGNSSLTSQSVGIQRLSILA